MKNQPDDRAKKVDEAMRLVISSLTSHLPYTYGGGKLPRSETKSFHKKSVKEYARIIHLLSELY